MNQHPTRFSREPKHHSLATHRIAHPRFRILALSPFEVPDLRLARALQRQNVAAVIDAGRAAGGVARLFAGMAAAGGHHAGVRIADHVDVGDETLPPFIEFVVAAGDLSRLPDHWWEVPIIAQVCSVAEAAAAIDAGAAGLIAKGQESGGLVGDESSFVLLQRVLALADQRADAPGLALPVWCQGGIGLNTAAGACAGGAFGVVIDAALAVYPQSSLPEPVKNQILAMDGSEVHTAGGYQVYGRGQRQAAEHAALSAGAVRAALAAGTLLPVGQDAALAALALRECPSLENLCNTLRMRIAGQIGQARSLRVLDAGNAWARAHGTRYPVAQGPMTRVSDTPEFAAAVADAGGLPFLALSMMREAPSRALMQATSDKLADKPWGVGVLAFASAEIVEPHLALVREFKPAFLVLAGGRPAQARPFVAMGIPTYLHVPSPGLLDMFLKDGAKHFIFEGRECGGHVGPRYSHVLWEQALALLDRVERPENLHILFAGGIHDARSGAMVAAIAARLAARGAKVGVLMGSAYIATREAVEAGAVLPRFQQKALEGKGTVLVETAPGHAIRCLPTGFVDLFERERERFRREGMERKHAWRALETLTVGRLRIATKGVDYVDGVLSPIDAGTQDAEGMYMLGQIIALRNSVIGMEELHAQVTRGACAFLDTIEPPALEPAAGAAPIAIVGMACLFPGAPDLAAYWANIVQGRDLVREVPADRWRASQYFADGQPAPGKSTSKWGGFIEPTPFDPLKYGIPPQSLAAIEPVQLLALDMASEALRDAGYEKRWFDREKTSVIFGAESGMDLANQYNFRNLYPHYCGELPPELDRALPGLTEDSFPGILVNVISGRIANRLGLGGVNYAVDSACASSLTAIELAVGELRTGASDMVLAGGADLHNGISDFLMFSSAGALSPTGRCRSFDGRADGIALGEGVGVIVLKRLADAQADGDRIYAVIEGIAGSSDGRGLGLTAPRREGQRRALERAYWQAGVLPGAVGLVEAHGTGTVVGDRTELETLTDIYCAGGAVPGQTVLGSVKSQIGHTKCAAGIAGMIKAALALHHRVLPPTHHIAAPNAGYRKATSPFRLEREPVPWMRAAGDAPARAAVSAFGFGGTNFHAVLRGFAAHDSAVGAVAFAAELFAIRANTMDEACVILRRITGLIAASTAPVALRDLAYAAWQAGSGPVQVAFAAASLAQVTERAGLALLRRSGSGVVLRPEAPAGKIACLFSGQGSQYPGMLRDLFVHFPRLLDIGAGSEYLALIYPPASYHEAGAAAAQQRLTQTSNAQPALGLVELAAFAWLQALGLKPDMAAGHSYGELAALAAAGAFDAPALIALSRARAGCIEAAVGDDPGAMAAVRLDADALRPLLADFPTVVMANQNSPVQTVISGPTEHVRTACAALERQGVGTRAIATSCAFHSPLMEGAVASYAAVLAGYDVGPLRWPVYGNVSATPIANDAEAIRKNLALHVASPVRFVEDIERMYDDGARVFLEIGPRQVLTGLVGRILKDRPHTAVALDQEKGFAGLLGALAELAVLLPAFDASPLFAGRVQKLDLDTPSMLPPAAWMVDGGRAWPLHGKPPGHAGTVLDAPVVRAPTTAAPAAGQVQPADQALIGYLANMRDMVNAQRDVLLGYFGAAPVPRMAASAPILAPPAPVPTAPAPVPAPAARGGDLLLDIVSDRTGYPPDMLDLDLDLEADLSIDSIKRLEIIGELAKRLDLQAALGSGADAALEQLAGRKTLRSMLAWLDATVPAAAAAPAPAPAVVEVAAPPTLSPTQILLEVVSACTGYPAEVLDLDLDLEADLSIDSIKRTEIAAQFATRAGAAEATQEGLSSLKTLRAMIAWLDEQAPAPAPAPATQARPQATLPLTRSVFEERPVEAGVAAPLSGRFVITDDGQGLAPSLAARLRLRGASAAIVPWLPATVDAGACDGLIHLGSLHRAGDDAKATFPLLRDALLAGTRQLVLATRPHGGIAGLAKCAAREFPALRVCAVTVDPAEPVNDIVAGIETLLSSTADLRAVTSRAGRLTRQLAVPAPLPGSIAAAPALTRESVVLITGGARGITAAAAIALAQRTQCRIELVGRSPLPVAAESPVTAGALSARELRTVLLAQDPGARPAEIEKLAKRLLADRDIRSTLAQIRAAGSEVSYTALDVREGAAFAAHIEGLYERHGRIDGVIHGAGVIEDRLIRDKTPESFARVFDTKVNAATVLHAKIRKDVGFVVFFSSISSAFGNRGQVDYAAANDVLDRLAHTWQAQIAGRVVAVNWGPWAGAGMVSNQLRQEYERQGIGLIPQDEGVDALLREIAAPVRDPQVLLMCGEVLP